MDNPNDRLAAYLKDLQVSVDEALNSMMENASTDPFEYTYDNIAAGIAALTHMYVGLRSIEDSIA